MSGRQTVIRDLPLPYHTRAPLLPHQEMMYVEAASMKTIADSTTIPENRYAFFRRIEFFLDRLQSAILTVPHLMSGHSADRHTLEAQQAISWRKNINHAAEHLRN